MLAFIFDSVGFGEWFILLAVVLIVVGPKKLPATARSIGNFYAKFRRAAEGFKRQLMDMEAEMDRAANDTAKELELDGAFQSSGDEGSVYPDENGFAMEGEKEELDSSSGQDEAGELENPDNPDNPEIPEEPDRPGVLGNPGKPDSPESPDNPDKPDNPEIPDKPDNPESPENPATGG